jgi:hypothetical protein
MARFFFYDEIVRQEQTPVDDIQWIAGQIANLPAFVDGTAVLCGSVSWGKPSWRSDIDVAHFSTIAHPHIETAIENIIRQYLERTNRRFIEPRVDIIPIGAESLSSFNEHKTISAAISLEAMKKDGQTTDVFVETAVLFADHIGSIARLKGDPWQSFFDRYLSTVDGTLLDRHKSIRSYVEKMTTEWIQQPFHYLNLSPDSGFTARHLDLISKSENYPVNLMRRILADLGRYPHPDRASDILEVFSALEAPWAKLLMSQFERFFLLDRQYEELVAACRRASAPLSAGEYYEQLRALFVDLPFAEIQNIVWEYVGA